VAEQIEDLLRVGVAGSGERSDLGEGGAGEAVGDGGEAAEHT
jgi:hypothetical protein